MAKTHKPMKNFFDPLTEEEIKQAETFVSAVINLLQSDYSRMPAPAVVLGLFALVHCYPGLKRQDLTISDAFTDWLAYSKRSGAL